jgi:uncharacterized protein YjbI with pentapeptide repeats
MAQLQGAILNNARLQGARFVFTQLQGASLIRAWMQGAELSRVQLAGALLDEAFLFGAFVRDSNLQGASLKSVQLEGASFYFDKLDLVRGADFSEARVWHSSLNWPLHSAMNPPLVKATDLQFSLELPFWILARAAKDANSKYDKILSASISGVLDQGYKAENGPSAAGFNGGQITTQTYTGTAFRRLRAFMARFAAKFYLCGKSPTAEVRHIQVYCVSRQSRHAERQAAGLDRNGLGRWGVQRCAVCRSSTS